VIPLTKIIDSPLCGGGGVAGTDDGSVSGKRIVAVSGKALIGSTGAGVGGDCVSAGTWSGGFDDTNGPWF
jgi:hypothetical protein